jgi:hypothetical protein
MMFSGLRPRSAACKRARDRVGTARVMQLRADGRRRAGAARASTIAFAGSTGTTFSVVFATGAPQSGHPSAWSRTASAWASPAGARRHSAATRRWARAQPAGGRSQSARQQARARCGQRGYRTAARRVGRYERARVSARRALARTVDVAAGRHVGGALQRLPADVALGHAAARRRRATSARARAHLRARRALDRAGPPLLALGARGSAGG